MYSSRPVREAADSLHERTSSAPPLIKSRWTPLIVTPESPPPAAKVVEDSPASPDTQTVSPQVRVQIGKVPVPTFLPVPSVYKYSVFLLLFLNHAAV
jgi:hypothetical protein